MWLMVCFFVVRLHHTLEDIVEKHLKNILQKCPVVNASSFLTLELDGETLPKNFADRQTLTQVKSYSTSVQVLVGYCCYLLVSVTSVPQNNITDVQGLLEFKGLFPDGRFFDLSQKPAQRARYGILTLPTLTKTCQYLWSQDACRFLRFLAAIVFLIKSSCMIWYEECVLETHFNTICFQRWWWIANGSWTAPEWLGGWCDDDQDFQHSGNFESRISHFGWKLHAYRVSFLVCTS